MKKLSLLLLAVAVLLFTSIPATAGDDLVQSVVNGCRNDLETHCSGVPAGKDRLLNCLEKNDSKVSDRCKQGLKKVGLRK